MGRHALGGWEQDGGGGGGAQGHSTIAAAASAASAAHGTQRLRERRLPQRRRPRISWLCASQLLLLLALLLLPLPRPPSLLGVAAMRSDRMAALRRRTVRMFYHGFDHYMRVAFPEDELRPLSCTPLTRDGQNANNVELNDVLGNYSLTLIDSLSTLAILAGGDEDDGRALRDFQDGVAALVELYGDGTTAGTRAHGFDLDSKIQVFETVIRGLGGLLSAHLFAVGELPIRGYHPKRRTGSTGLDDDEDDDAPIPWPNGLRYDGQLLRLALDLGTRLLPAFYTTTGMPYPRVNLRHGIPFYHNSPLHRAGAAEDGGDDEEGGDGSRRRRAGPNTEITETCSAGAGSLVLEFTVLSRLTGDGRFEQLAKRAFWAVWYRRSEIGLIGAGVDAEQGGWIGGYSVIGAGADSFFEYAFKSHILLSGQGLPNKSAAAAVPRSAAQQGLDPNTQFPPLSDGENSAEAFLEAWHLAHAAIKRHLYSEREHPHYVNVNIWTGSLASQWIDSLGAYYPGLLALAGELDEAVATNMLHAALWTRYAALPERWSLKDRAVEGGLGWWPLRPEFVESTYHLYRATRDPWYLYVGEMVQRDIFRRCWTRCGWAGLQNVVDGQQSDRMESFFLGETAKYMYLLFDEAHPLNSLDAAYVFTTEGHPLIIPRAKNRRAGGGRRRPRTSGGPKEKQENQQDELAAGVYNDDGFTRTCPVPPKPAPFSGSAVAARPDMYHAAKILDLHLQERAVDSDLAETLGTGGGSDDDSDGAGNRASDGGSAGISHTFFPWTLPSSVLPGDGVCAPVQMPLEMSLEFAVQTPPNNQNGLGSAFNGAMGGHFAGFGSSLTLHRLSNKKIRVLTISGLKLVFRLEEGSKGSGGDPANRTWRVTRVNGLPLGRDELLVMDRRLLHHVSDPRFSVVRDPLVVKFHHMHQAVWMPAEKGDDDDGEDGSRPVLAVWDKQDEEGAGDEEAGQQVSSEAAATAAVPPLEPIAGLGTFVRSFWRQIMSSLDGLPPATPLPADGGGGIRTGPFLHQSAAAGGDRGTSGNRKKQAPIDDSNVRAPVNVVLNLTGVVPSGVGAAPLPAVDVAAGAFIPASGSVPSSLLPWTTVYAGGMACGFGEDDSGGEGTKRRAEALPETAARDHQVLVLRRGGCSFSEKLARVPAFVPSPRSLQLVVVVSDDDDVVVLGQHRQASFYDDVDDFVRPLLDEPQRTPGGLPRRHPLAMIMVGGGEEAYAQIAQARQLGLTRRYGVESQGIRIRNILLDDGDSEEE